MTEMDKLEEFLMSTGITYARRPVFAAMSKGPEQIAAYDSGRQIWNVVEAGDGTLEYAGPEGLWSGLTAQYLIDEGLVW